MFSGLKARVSKLLSGELTQVTGTNVSRDSKFALDVAIQNSAQRTSYGVEEAISNYATVRSSPVYGLIPANFREFTSGTGTTGVENREYKTSTGNQIYGYGAIQSFRSLKLEYGETGLSRFCARFPDAVANSWQGVGLISITDELSFGMNGTSFGVWHRYGGEVEVRTFQVTTPASGSENATVTINGTGYTVPLTASTEQTNAKQIADYLNTNATGFAAEQLDDTVYVSSLSDGAKSGVWSFSSSSAVATVTRVTAGVTKTSTFVAQSDFNKSQPFSGFDHTKSNLYSISYGAGGSDIAFRIFSQISDRFELVHQISIVSSDINIAVNNPALRCGVYSASVGSIQSVSTYCSFISGFAQGRREATRNPRAFANTKSISTTLTNVLTIRNKRIYNGYVNQAEIEPLVLTVANETNKNIVIEVRSNPTVAGTTNFQALGENLIVETEVTGTTVTQDGRYLTGVVVAPGDSAYLDLQKLEIKIPPTLRLVVAARQLSGGAAGNVTTTLTWREDI